MSKRKQLYDDNEVPETPSKRLRNAAAVDSGRTSGKKGATTPRRSQKRSEERVSSPTPKANGAIRVSTPRKGKRSATGTPVTTRTADRSARRKSAHRLAEVEDEDDWDGKRAIAAEILGDEAGEEGEEEETARTRLQETIEAGESTPTATPSRRGRGRPKGSRNKRTPTPEGDIAPEERYFFQNRAGPSQYSTNLFTSVRLLTHDEYFEQMKQFKDGHQSEKAHLFKLHKRSFPQWKFELGEGYNVCLYGYGSKRQLITTFAEWIHTNSSLKPKIVIVNGYTPKLGIRQILNIIGSAIVPEGEILKLAGQPHEMLDTLLSRLTDHPLPGKLVIMVNSIDAPSLRKGTAQSILARLAASSNIHLIATADTTTFPLMWNSSLLEKFNFVFHDCTTFAPYESEISVVDEVYDVLGRKGRRIGGKEGIGFVLKSLPPNARSLYRILLSEILSILNDTPGLPTEEGVEIDEGRPSRPTHEAAEDVGVEYRLLYHKATEEFVCSSDMNFRFLLKEFHDHQMITSRRDASGTELLCVPLGMEEMQAVLEDLVIA